MSELLCLNPEYSTTRRISRVSRLPRETPGADFARKLFLPPHPERKGEGGLRTRGYVKAAAGTDDDAATGGDHESRRPLVTVITVVFNGAKTLEQAIISVITRSYDNIEFVIIDGGSTDGTLDIIKKYDHAIDYWVSEPDKGIYDAMNKALDVALGDRIYFLGCDDLLVNDLRNFALLFRRRDVLYYGDVYLIHQHRLYDGAFNGFKLVVRNICQQAIFYPRGVFKKYRFDTRYQTLADYHLNICCYADPDLSLTYVPELVAIYNDSSGASSSRVDDVLEKDRNRLTRQYFPTSIYLYSLLHEALRRLLGFFGLKRVVKTALRKLSA
ncbi:MAG: glycosyltransferase [Betaproteobacteria bacterium]|nr:glycosyltransferase [Betaproteobacteria bacterium]MDH5350185.1 glycosyltransferase [Betaproteobacteria bacterium]